MKENLILEGNTIYEIDPVCMRMKTQPQQRQAAGGGRMTEVKAEGDRREDCGCENFSCGRNIPCRSSHRCSSRSSRAILGALILAGCQAKRRGWKTFCGR